MFLAIIAIMLTLLLVVGIHEAAHAVVARYFQVKIKKISIGFGKPLLRWQSSSGCEWIWAMFPLGGYVQLENTRISPVPPAEYANCFDKKPIWQRILILLAGVIANVITAWIALVLVYTLGLNYTLPQVQSVQPDSPAAVAGIAAGDQFVSIAGHATPTWNEVGMQMVILWGQKEVSVVLNRGNELKEVTLNLNHVNFRGAKLNLLSQLGLEANLSAARDTLRFTSLSAVIHQANGVLVTYNYPQGRLTDHRINLTIYQLNEVMEGNLSLVIDALQREYHAELLAELGRND